MNDDELAAVIAAVNAAMQSAEEPQPERMPAWRRAMRVESVSPFSHPDHRELVEESSRPQWR